MARRKVEIDFNASSDISVADLRGYIIEALESSGGSRDPCDTLFHSLEITKVKFVPVNKTEIAQ